MQFTATMLSVALAIFSSPPSLALPSTSSSTLEAYNFSPKDHLESRGVLNARGVAPNTQSCTASQRGCCIAAYGVNIGIAYNGGSGCNDVLDALRAWDTLISNWQCVDDGAGNTQLYFNAATGGADVLNDALHRMYPTVNGFNCPNY